MTGAYYYGQSNSYRVIADKTGLMYTSKSSVQRILQILTSKEIEEETFDFKTQLRYHFVLYKSMKNPFITNQMISQDSSEFEFKISTSEVSRILKNLNIKCLYQRPKEKLNQNQKIYRYNFSLKIQSSELFLFPWAFSDESIIALEPMKKKVKIIPFIENSKYYFEKQGYPPHIMIWGCIAKDFKSPLIRIDKKLNSKNYIEMLEQNKIIELLNGRFGEKSYVFQQDGAPAHRANKTRDFLYDKVKMLLGDLHWPANSPDLNVIEHLWGIIKAKIDLTNVTNLDELFIQVQKIWDEIPIEVVNNLIDSFQNRIKACMLLSGESLNGKKKFLQEFKVSYENGLRYIQNRNLEIQLINEFISKSHIFFNKLCHLDLDTSQCNRLNCTDSTKICNALPKELLKKTDMPKKTIIIKKSM